MKFNDLALANELVINAVLERARGAVTGNRLILGPHVEEFERELAKFCRAEHAVGVSSGTDALALALQAVGVSAGDEVITVANTAPPTVSAIRMIGAVPVFVDVDTNGLMCPDKLRSVAQSCRAKAVVPVHLYGRKCNMQRIATVAASEGLAVVEDAAQGIGLSGLGEWSDAVALSFYPTKNLGAWGDAGAVLTRRGDVAERVARARNQGMSGRDWQTIPGRNARLDPIQAIVLQEKLRCLSEWQEQRRLLALRYSKQLVYNTAVSVETNWHLLTIHHERRDDLQRFLAERGIETLIHYRLPLHQQPANRDLPAVSLPQTEWHCSTVLSLPLFPGMREHAVDTVCLAVRDYARAISRDR